MAEIIGVRFSRSGKVYYFSPGGENIEKGAHVIVETSRGVEFGYVMLENLELPEEMLPQELKHIVRVADEDDARLQEENQRLAKDALAICEIKVHEHQLDMRLISSEYTFDKNKLIFYFTSDNRVDFRELVRDLAQTFRTRIELRQVGVRDQAKMVGGLGTCGQEVCCHRYMSDFVPVSIKMAKTQGLSLNPAKISGVCGRLMCCLNYEQEVYLEHNKQAPEIGSLVLTVDGQGYVVDRDVLQRRVRVRVYKEDHSQDEKYYDFDALRVIEKRKKGQHRPALREELMGVVYDPSEPEGCAQCGCPQKEEPVLVASAEPRETVEEKPRRRVKRAKEDPRERE